jgi:glutaminyl-tRNA synthetase
MTRTDPTGARASHFIREIIEEDLKIGAYTRVVTRFPPEPNGYLHIGHAKAICLDFGLAADYGGACHLRFDDTNPTTEDPEYVEAIQRDIRWLGFDWGENLFYASDYFERFYQHAVRLVERGRAYVDSSSEDEIRALRGTLAAPGSPSRYRSRSVEENLDLLRRMRAGEFPDGAHVLRGMCDLAAANMKMRDPVLYRIRHAPHYRTGNAWPIYPMYDYAHPLSDAIEGVTHSICTLEFENNRELYDWVLEACETEARPKQIEFARLRLGYTVLSKRKLLRLVQDQLVDGWDDPRMPTLAGLRRRGITPEAIRGFCDRIGVAKANSTVDLGKLEFSIRSDLNRRAPRVMCVLRPLKVVLDRLPAAEEIEAPSFPPDVGRPGSRRVPLTREIYIERDDFEREPPPGFHRLSPGSEVRLRHAGIIRCEEVVADEAGEVRELRCRYRAAGAGDEAVKGIVHWVSADRSLPCEVTLDDRLFSSEKPDEEAEFLEQVNPASRERLTSCRIEPSALDAAPGARFQFERQGYFVLAARDQDGRLAFHRVLALRDSWSGKAPAQAAAAQAAAAPAKPRDQASQASHARKKNPKAASRPHRRSGAEKREIARTRSSELMTRFERFTGELGLGHDDAELLTGDLDLAAFFEAAVNAGAAPGAAASFVKNELLGHVGDRPIDSLPFGGTQIGRLVCLIDDGVVSTAGGKEVLAELLDHGGEPASIVNRRGLRQVSDAAELEPMVDRVIADNPDPVSRYRAGKTGLFGFLVGQVMKASGGAANPALVQELFKKKLG